MPACLQNARACALAARLGTLLLALAAGATAETAQPPPAPAATQAGRILLQDDDTVVVRAAVVWEDAQAEVLHFEGRFDMRTREWRILADQATAFGAVNDPDRIVVTGAPARVWLRRALSGSKEIETVYGEGAELEYLKVEERLLMRGDAVLIEQGNRLTSAEIEYDLAAERFRASGKQGVEITVEGERAP